MTTIHEQQPFVPLNACAAAEKKEKKKEKREET